MFDEEHKTETYILVGLVNGNPKGCRSGDRERLFPDYHVSVGDEEVRKQSEIIGFLGHPNFLFQDVSLDRGGNAESGKIHPSFYFWP